MHLIILVDISGSMDGAKIGAVNDCMSNLIISLQELAFNGSDLFLSILSFARNTEWMHDKPLSILDFDWKELQANGMTSLGAACLALADWLNKYKDQKDNTVILLTDGCPTDDYDEGITNLEHCPQFINAKRYGIAIGTDADIPSIQRFVGNTENIHSVLTMDSLIEKLTSTIQECIEPQNKNEVFSNKDTDDEWD